MGQNCILEVTEKVAYITINRPPLNTLSRDTLYEIGTYLDDIENNPDIRAIVLTGAGEKSFSAGADVNEFADLADPEKARSTIQGMHDLFNRIESYPKPIIASINGRALGGGNELQMACHLVIAADTAEFALPEIKLGIMPGYGGTQRLTRLIGRRRALDLILSGDKISANKALEYGLINKVVPANMLKFETLTIANRLAEGPPLAIKGILDSVMRGTEVPLEEGISIELDNMLKITKSEDAMEGISAFFMKRKAEFSGK